MFLSLDFINGIKGKILTTAFFYKFIAIHRLKKFRFVFNRLFFSSKQLIRFVNDLKDNGVCRSLMDSSVHF